MTVRELIEELERCDNDEAIVCFPIYVNTAPYGNGHWETEEITEVGYNKNGELELS